MNANPLSQLATVEANLTAAINAAADHLDALGTVGANNALARLQVSATAAQARLTATTVAVFASVNSVVDAFAVQTYGILEALALNAAPTVPSIPAQIAVTTPPTQTEDVPLADALVAAAVSIARKDALPPLVREVIDTIACDSPQNVQEPRQDVATNEDEAVAAAPANSPAETPDQTMARVLLPSHEPTTATAKKRNRRGKADQADASSGAAD